MIREKKEEANEGFDGSWVTHPMLVETARKCFGQVIENTFNQKQRFSTEEYCLPFNLVFTFINSKVGNKFDISVEKPDILKSIRVCIIYYFNWLKGIGAVAFENLMEDTATVEICRAQLWLWVKNRVTIIDKGK